MAKFIIDYTINYPLTLINADSEDSAIKEFEKFLTEGLIIPKSVESYNCYIDNKSLEYPILEVYSRANASENKWEKE